MIWHPSAKIFLNDIVISQSNVNEILRTYKADESWESDVLSFLGDYLNESKTIEIQSSGSTGNVKNMLVLKDRMVNSARASGELFKLNPGDFALLPLSISYIAGKMMVVRALALGLSLQIVKPSSNPLLENIFSKNIDFATFVPMQLYSMLNDKTTASVLNQISKVIIGGTSIEYNLLVKIREMSNTVFETFGMAETLSHIAVRQVNNTITLNSPFNALPGVNFTVDDRNCLVINAPHILDAALVTNDIVDLLDERSFYWMGRFDNIINTGGIKIFPEIVEKQIEQFIVNKFCITSLPSDILGQKLVLVIEQSGTKNLQLDMLLKQMIKTLPRYSYPKEIYLIQELFRNRNGKVVRKQITDYIIYNNIQPIKTF